MRKRLTMENPGLYLINAEGVKVARITTLTMELLDGSGIAPAPAPAPELQEQDRLDVGGDAVAIVWEHYVQVMRPRSAGLDSQTRAVIRDALKVATIEDCKGAVNGCKASEFHMGVNDRHRKYNRITHILKGKRGTRTTREQIDLFLDIAARSGVAGVVTSADSARISDAKRDMQTASEFPGDEHVAQRGKVARAWLEAQGWTITTDEDGWPTFHPPA